MKYFLDCEFIDDGKTIDLISIGIVQEDDKIYYAASTEFNFSKASDWVKDNVLYKLPRTTTYWKSREQIKNEILEFIGDDKPEFWGFYCAYDWVCFCQLFGRMIDLPEGWSKCCRDLKVLLDDRNITKEDLKHIVNDDEHDALADAYWNKAVYEYIIQQTFGDIL
jgi:hypothetical protein